MRFYNTTLISIFFSLCAILAKAQTNSPYSRYGMGDILNQENIANTGMGGVSMGDNNIARGNYLNPASYASLKFTSLQFALTGVRSHLRYGDSVKNVGDFGINYLTLSVPLTKHSGLSFGLVPYSRVNYGIEIGQKYFLDSNTLFTNYIGGGSIQEVFTGYAYKIKNFSIGLNANFLFGNYSNRTIKVLDTEPNFYYSKYDKSKYMKGLIFNIGAMYEYKLTPINKKDRSLNFGITYTPAATLNASRDILYATTITENTGRIFEDTVLYVPTESGKILLPSSFAAGVLYNQNNQLKLGLDFTSSNWSTFRDFGTIDSTGDSFKLKIGGSYLPELNKTSDKWKRIEYRAGFYFGNTNYKINGTTITDRGISFGAGFPLPKSNDQDRTSGTINTALQIGSKGVNNQGLILDSYARFSVGITVNGIWFQKRKYD
jgi:hypothetical protein